MRAITIALLSLTLSPPHVAAADIVKIETNEWSDKRTLTWTGSLQSIDSTSKVARFKFKNRTRIEEFQVHVTRIYSLTLDSQDRVDRSFPATKQDLSTPLPSNPRSTEVLELSNQNFVGDEIPSTVKVRPDRSSSILYLSGTIMHGDLQMMMLEAKAENRGTSAFKIGRSDLLKWIRGR